jgi:HNH endonuclease
MVEPLAEVQHGLCLCCQRRAGPGEVDHFVPWSRYPRDLAHNLVLAHKDCNRNKCDLLASEVHLDRWLQRNSEYESAIGEAGRRASIIVDLPAAVNVAAWAYAHGTELSAAAWLSGDTVEPLTGRWRSMLGANGSGL